MTRYNVLGREAAASASLRYRCVCNRSADVSRWVKADDMVMSSLPEAMGREGITIPSVGKGSRGTCAGCGKAYSRVMEDDDAASSLPDALGREATALASLFVF